MTKFLMRPLEVEAAMFDGNTVGDRAKDGMLLEGTTPEWFKPIETSRTLGEISVPLATGEIIHCCDGLKVGSHRGNVNCMPGDWLVMYPDGSLYVEKADVFAVTYALPLDVVTELGGEMTALAEKEPKSWLGRIVAGAKALVKSDQEKLF